MWTKSDIKDGRRFSSYYTSDKEIITFTIILEPMPHEPEYGWLKFDRGSCPWRGPYYSHEEMAEWLNESEAIEIFDYKLENYSTFLHL